MGKICIRKRGNYYEYRVEIAHQDNTRKWISKSGFNSKQEAYESGTQAYNEYLNVGVPFKASDISYSDYLDYWMDNYCLNNLKYNTIMTYKIIINKYLKPYMGKYKLSTITSVSINSFITDLVNKYDYSKSYFKNILKVIKGSFRDACNIYGFIKYNSAQSIRLPKIDKFNDDIKHLYTKEEIDLILRRFKDNKTFICAFLVSCLTDFEKLTYNFFESDDYVEYDISNKYTVNSKTIGKLIQMKKEIYNKVDDLEKKIYALYKVIEIFPFGID